MIKTIGKTFAWILGLSVISAANQSYFYEPDLTVKASPPVSETALVSEEKSSQSVKEVKESDEPQKVEPTSTFAEPEEQSSSSEFVTADDVAVDVNETVFTTMGVQLSAPWGLDRIDGSMGNGYDFPENAGQGVSIYIVDTGIDAQHPELIGRVASGYDSFGQNLSQTDCHGHGTHVAGIAGGNYFGVAKNATLVPVRVLDCNGVGNTTTLTAGINWILNNHSSGLGVVNLSLGGDRDPEVDQLVNRMTSSNLLVVSAAGNSASDACNYSPAGSPGSLGVGATDIFDNTASFSNYGSCVDISAPGVNINSANAKNYNFSKALSGTSQAAPFVSGVLATYISSGVSSTGTATQKLYELATSGIASVERSAPEPIEEPIPEPEIEPEPEPTPDPVVDPVEEVEPTPSPEPVQNPELPEIRATFNSYIMGIGGRSITFGWDAVSGARLYSVRIGRASDTYYYYRKNTSSLSLTKRNLSPGEYWAVIVPLVKGVETGSSIRHRFTIE